MQMRNCELRKGLMIKKKKKRKNIKKNIEIYFYKKNEDWDIKKKNC